MSAKEISLERVVFEARYPYGHLFYDRCGQTLLDIENNFYDWVAAVDDNNTGVLQNPNADARIIISNNTFNFMVKRPNPDNLEPLFYECQEIFKIVENNFGLDVYTRMGLRPNWLKPTESAEEADARVLGSSLTVSVPEEITTNGFVMQKQNVLIALQKDGFEYRVEMGGIIRAEGIDPASLIRQDPKSMSENQRNARLAAMKRAAEYRANPKYGIQLDVDCVLYGPKELKVMEFSLRQMEIVLNNFLPILQGI